MLAADGMNRLRLFQVACLARSGGTPAFTRTRRSMSVTCWYDIGAGAHVHEPHQSARFFLRGLANLGSKQAGALAAKEWIGKSARPTAEEGTGSEGRAHV